jgi:hypothetical protein
MRVILMAVLLWGGAGVPRTSVAQELNACGCYRGTDGNCVCTKTKTKKCACAGDCEPVGCEAQREKQANKDAEAALKRIDAKEKKKAAEAAKEPKKGKKKR